MANTSGWAVLEEAIGTILNHHASNARKDIHEALPTLVLAALGLNGTPQATAQGPGEDVRALAQKLAAQTPRKRGRPKKAAAAAPAVPAATTPAKKRGRPKKAAVAAAPAAPAEAPKKRGRPKKAAAQAATPPKKRGRPPKAAQPAEAAPAAAPAPIAPVPTLTPVPTPEASTSESYEALRARVAAMRGEGANASVPS